MRRGVLGLLALAVVVLGGLAWNAEILFADGLRYIDQARRLERGEWHGGVWHAVDHPLYPAAIALAHGLLGVSDSPVGWQAVAQGVAVAAGVLLVVPLWLIARELFGPSTALLGGLFAVLSPVPAHVMADTLSESTFLLVWTWGLWASVRFVRVGGTFWLVLASGLGALSYFARPEGLLLPVSLGATLGLGFVRPSAQIRRRGWISALLLLGLGLMVLVGPFMALKGGIATKPAVARLIGLAPPSARDAVERERPLDPGQSIVATYGSAARSMLSAIRGVVTLPLLPFAALGLVATIWRRGRSEGRVWLLLGVVGAGSMVALVRLHATGGYCTPRHALIPALPLLLAAAAGVRVAVVAVLGLVSRSSRRVVLILAPRLVVLLWLVVEWPALVEPVNAGQGAYRTAGAWLETHVAKADRVIDVTGWSLFYGQRSGYAFANLHEAQGDPRAHWVVVRDAHLAGPWGYCETLRGLVAGARVVARFPEQPAAGSTRVTVYERARR